MSDYAEAIIANPFILVSIAIIALTILLVDPNRSSAAKLWYWAFAPCTATASFVFNFRDHIESATDLAGGIFWSSILVYTFFAVSHFRMKRQ